MATLSDMRCLREECKTQYFGRQHRNLLLVLADAEIARMEREEGGNVATVYGDAERTRLLLAAGEAKVRYFASRHLPNQTQAELCLAADNAIRAVLAFDEAQAQNTKQGGGAESGRLGARSPVGTESVAAAGSFEERVEAVLKEEQDGFIPRRVTTYNCALRAVKAEDALKAAEKERDEARAESDRSAGRAERWLVSFRDVVSERDQLRAEVADLKAKLDAERKACDEWRMLFQAWSGNGTPHCARFAKEPDEYDWYSVGGMCAQHDARRAAEGK